MKNDKKIFGQSERIYLILFLIALSYFVLTFALMYLEMNFFGGDSGSVLMPVFFVITVIVSAFYGRECIKKIKNAISLQLVFMLLVFIWSFSAMGMYYSADEDFTVSHTLLFGALYTILTGIVLLSSGLVMRLSGKNKPSRNGTDAPKF